MEYLVTGKVVLSNLCVVKLNSKNWPFITNISSVRIRTWPAAGFSRCTSSPQPPRWCISCILKPLLLVTAECVLCSVAAPLHLPALPVLAWFTLSPPAPHSLFFTCHSSQVTSACRSLTSSLLCVDPCFRPLGVHPLPLCHQGLNVSVLMEPAAVSLLNISDSSYVCVLTFASERDRLCAF